MAAKSSHDASGAATSVSNGAPDAGNPPPKKLHGRAFYESIGSPKYVIAPMVDQSEFAWRMLSRSFLPPSQRSSILAYSPMLHARLFAEGQKYRDAHFQPLRGPPNDASPAPVPGSGPSPWLDGNPSIDRPLFVQFCANDPETLLAAARLAAPHCDAVDLNLGCPQGIARKGHYGAFLQEDQDLIYRLVNTLHEGLDVPVTAKIRILDTREATLAYARTVLRAGASILAVHGRRREQKGHMTGLADWAEIRYLRENLPPETVLFANGNILGRADLERCLAATGADAVMSAEGHLSDPAIFAPEPAAGEEGAREYWRGRDGRGGWRVDAVLRRYLDILHRHVLDAEPPARRPLFLAGDEWPAAWAEQQGGEEGSPGQQPPKKKRKKDDVGRGPGKLSQSPNLSGTQAHLFHLLRHFVTRHTDVRDALAKARCGDIAVLERILDMVERRVADGLIEYERSGGESIEEGPGTKAGVSNGSGVAEGKEDSVDEAVEEEDDTESSARVVRERKRPWWVAQPIIRPLPKEAIAKGAVTLKKAKGGNGKAAEPVVCADAAKRAEDDEVAPGSGGGSGSTRAELERKTSYPQSELVSG